MPRGVFYLELLLDEGLPDAATSVREPVLELLLADTRHLHQLGLVLRRRVRVREVLVAQQPLLKDRYGLRSKTCEGFNGWASDSIRRKSASYLRWQLAPRTTLYLNAVRAYRVFFVVVIVILALRCPSSNFVKFRRHE